MRGYGKIMYDNFGQFGKIILDTLRSCAAPRNSFALRCRVFRKSYKYARDAGSLKYQLKILLDFGGIFGV